MIIERDAYQNFHYNGTNFRQSIQDPDSRLRKLIEFVENSKHHNRGFITKHDFYWSIQPKRAFHRSENIKGDYHVRTLRSGWNQTFWSAVQKAGVIKRHEHKMRDLHGRWYYEKGDKWDWWLTTYLFFTKDHGVSRWVYDEEDIPEGYTVKSTQLDKKWSHLAVPKSW